MKQAEKKRSIVIVGENLGKILAEGNISRKQLAEAVCVSPSTVGRWIRGEREMPLPTFINVAKFLGVMLDDLVREPVEREYCLFINDNGKLAVREATKDNDHAIPGLSAYGVLNNYLSWKKEHAKDSPAMSAESNSTLEEKPEVGWY